MKGNMSQALEKAEHNSLLNRDFPNQHPISAIEGLKEALEGKVTRERKVNGQTLDKDVEITEVKSAEKLKTARTVSLSGAVESTPTDFDGSGDANIYVRGIKESFLSWGGKNLAVNISPIDVALVPELSTNRLAFFPNSAIKLEQSDDAGATWIDVSSDFDGTTICTTVAPFGIGNSKANKSVDRQNRITLDTISGGLVCILAKIIFQVDTDGATGCLCKVECGDKSENTVWTTIATASVFGWSGWNVINIEPTLIGKDNRYVRLTFSISGVTDDYGSNLAVSSLRFISKEFFGTAPSTMAKTGRVYSVSRDQKVTFPNNIIVNGNAIQLGNTTLTETQLQALLALLT